ncbi:putative flavoprotein involved in K+ transport [Jatrophihabitans endophyticus]|uniref:Putative flavoprotein involved in K+ transport n=1 Tax=Jatrophihabitans endophyticus TaxID=1206085 RepID=A0A1M5I7A7_9ACTN|nr:NAD(P)/FAD-dependent oxidoreductase [Jatrophihabitans endophyticus]SHG23830.1 putative flavoprotein involved in K+ transport [Jatrophihabitans endophyticus]
MTEHIEVAIVGGGQSGLVAGYYLQRADIPYVILDAGPEAGHSWRRRWDSLELFTIARYCELPGMRFPGGWNRFPDKDELADYLEMYHRTFRQPVRWNTAVTMVDRAADGGYVLHTSAGDITATQVVLATGAYRNTFTPSIAAGLSDDVVQVHTGDYRNPSTIPGGRVVVVGAANSGAQIAVDLHETHDVLLSQGSPIPHGPRKFLGIGLHWWGDKLGIIAKPLLGERDRIHKKTILVGKSLQKIAKETGVQLRDRTVACEGRTVTFEDGTSAEVDAVVWATGFRPDYTKWVSLPIFGEDGFPRHVRGVVDEAPGLYFLGMQCQYTYGSGLIWWVKEDAEYLVDKIRGYEPTAPDPSAPLPTVEQTAATG